MLSGASRDRPVIVGWSTALRGQVINEVSGNSRRNWQPARACWQGPNHHAANRGRNRVDHRTDHWAKLGQLRYTRSQYSFVAIALFAHMMVLGALFFAAPPFLYPFVHDPWSLLALRFVHGFATAIFSPVASAYVASLAETGRGARLGWFSSANDIGATGGPLVGGFVLYFTTSFSLTYLLVGALGVLTLLVVVLLPDVDRPARQDKDLCCARWRSSGRGSPRCSGHRRSSSRPASKPSCISATAPFSASCRSTPRRSGSTMPRSQSSSARSWPSPWWRSRSPDV